jgi:hypothetical protein
MAKGALLSAEEKLLATLGHADDVQGPARGRGRALPDQNRHQSGAA